MNKWDFLIQLSKTTDDQYILKVGDAVYKAEDFETVKGLLIDKVSSIVSLFEGRYFDSGIIEDG